MPGGSSINWDETKPADADGVGSGDDEIRSLKTSLRQALASEHAWPSAGGLSGYHTYGSARPYVGVQSNVSSDGTDGRLMFASDTSRFFALQSTGTVLVGGPQTISHGSYPGSTPQRHHWVMESGQTVTTTGGVGLVTFPNSGFSGVPITTATTYVGSGNFGVIIAAAGAASVQFTAFDSAGAGVSGITVNWMSLGSRVL